MRRTAAVILVAALAAIILLAGLFWATSPSPGPGEMRVPAKTPFTKGHYFLFLQPWGGESYAPTRLWSRYADSAIIDYSQFPARTAISWRWPPFPPSNGVGVWAYNALSYGSYDGGAPEQPVAPITVSKLKALSQSFSWSMTHRFGDANVLTEFYLDPPVLPVTAHKVEIGFFLHVPDNTRLFFESVPRSIGHYVDRAGRGWTVRMGGTFCMFAPDGYRDVNQGSLDMLDALRWLKGRGVIDGTEVFPGVALGAEAVQGTGQLKVDRWTVTME